MGAQQITGLVGLVITIALLLLKAGRWSAKYDSIGSAFKVAVKNGNGDSVADLLKRIAALETQVTELNALMRVMQAERALLFAQNKTEHDDFRAYISGITRRLDGLIQGA